MKRLNIFLIAVTLIFSLTTFAKADLFDRGDNLIYDDDLDITWLQYSNYAGATMSWYDADIWAENLVFQGYDDWRLPSSDDTCSGSGCTGSEMGHLFYVDEITSELPGLFTDVRPSIYWSSTENSTDTTQAWRFSFKYGTQGTSDKEQTRYAWAVRDGGSAPPVVPEPISSILFITGSATLSARRYWKKRGECKL